MIDTGERFFFVHVMKTGGTALREQLRANFAADQVYPDYESHESVRFTANFEISRLLALSAERRERLRLYMGHFPFAATQMMGLHFTTFTILRDPVDRIVSFLKQRKREHEVDHERSLEEIYEHPARFPNLIHNHQVKVFALTPDEHPGSVKDHIVMDDSRLAIAKANLEQVDVVGINDRYAEFLEEMARRFGFEFRDPTHRQFVSREPWTASKDFRRRIASDNEADLEFYEFALDLEARRRP